MQLTETDIRRKLTHLAQFVGEANEKAIMDILIQGFISPGTTTYNVDTISEYTSGSGVTIDGLTIKDGGLIRKPTPVTINTTATATVAQILSGYITSSTAAAVSITTPTATELATALGAVQGYSFELSVENTGASNNITMVLGSGWSVITPAITGGATLTISPANDIGLFRFTFLSATSGRVLRIA